MKNRIALLFVLVFTVIICAPSFSQNDKGYEEVKQILMRQADDWNRGDIDAFMQGYWKSDKLQFVGGNGVTYGWQNTLTNYKKRYPDKEAMGRLEFEIVSVEKLSKKSIQLVGKWTLYRTNDQTEGHFLLVWKKIKGQWLIISDCTNSKS